MARPLSLRRAASSRTLFLFSFKNLNFYVILSVVLRLISKDETRGDVSSCPGTGVNEMKNLTTECPECNTTNIILSSVKPHSKFFLGKCPSCSHLLCLSVFSVAEHAYFNNILTDKLLDTLLNVHYTLLEKSLMFKKTTSKKLHCCPKCKSTKGIKFSTESHIEYTADYETKKPRVKETSTHIATDFAHCIDCHAAIDFHDFWEHESRIQSLRKRVIIDSNFPQTRNPS